MRCGVTVTQRTTLSPELLAMFDPGAPAFHHDEDALRKLSECFAVNVLRTLRGRAEATDVLTLCYYLHPVLDLVVTYGNSVLRCALSERPQTLQRISDEEVVALIDNILNALQEEIGSPQAVSAWDFILNHGKLRRPP